MKTDIKTLQDSFESWYTINEASRKETSLVLNMYHNRQWAPEQVIVLENRGQPKETFNIIKLLTRGLVGYYSSVVNRAVAEPRNYNAITKTTLLNDALGSVYEANDFEMEDDDIKTYGILTGLFVSYTSVKASGKQDEFGQNLYEINIESINPEEVVIDPLSQKRDYSDARGIHRFKWMEEESIKKLFGKNQATIDKLDEYRNHLNIDEAEYTYRYDNEFIGKYSVDNMYLVVHSVVDNESIFWCGNVELSRTKIDKNPFTVTRLQKSNREEYYGIFREVIESQKAINQALIQIQLLVNSNKVIVETDAVEDVDEFADTIARVNAVAEVEDLKGVMIQNMSQNVIDQYTIIDKGYQRIKEVLGINDAMLGQAYAADSGRKVKLQKNNAVMTLRYLTAPMEIFHKSLAKLVAFNITTYFTAHQILRVTDEITGNRFIELNKPVLIPKLPPQLQQLVAQGLPIEYAFEAMLTGQLNPAVQQAMQQQQQWQQQQQVYQQEQQQIAQANNQIKMQMVNNKMSGDAPQITPTTPAPGPNPIAALPNKDISNVIESTPKAQMNKAMAVKKADAPEGMSFLYEEMINPITGEPERDKEGNIYLVPVVEEGSKLDITEYDIVIKPSSYDDEDEKAQLMMEVLLNGPAGQFAMKVSPAYYAKMVSLNTQSMKTKFSPEIAQMFNQMAMQLGANPEFEAYIREVTTDMKSGGGSMHNDGNGGMLPGGGPSSQELKLPQNTNEGF